MVVEVSVLGVNCLSEIVGSTNLVRVSAALISFLIISRAILDLNSFLCSSSCANSELILPAIA